MFAVLHCEFSPIFNSNIVGYNGAVGAIQAVVHLGPTQPTQRMVNLPQFDRLHLINLQVQFDEFEAVGIKAVGVSIKPENFGVCVEYANSLWDTT